MKILVCGSRTMPHTYGHLVYSELLYRKCSHVIQGGAHGADWLAKQEGLRLGLQVTEVPADWDNFGKKAGHIRNREMLNHKPDLVLAFYSKTGITRGTLDMCTQAMLNGYPVVTVVYDPA